MNDRHINPLIYGIIVCTWIAVTCADYGYMFTPRYLVPGTDYKVTVDISHYLESSGGTYDVTASIKLFNPLAYLVNRTKTFYEGYPVREIALPIPDDFDPYGRSVRVVIDVSSNGVRYASDDTFVSSLGAANDTILIQTDKGLYKAGQTVQFRIVHVNSKREVEIKTMTIDIFDGENNRVRRWANVSDNTGVFVGKMEMSQYPVLGTWSIEVKAEGGYKTQNFEVKEFELPKFDLTLELPDVISESDIILEGTIRSLYTFGKGVTGSVKLSLSVSYEPGNKYNKIYKLVDGEAEIKIELTDMFRAFDDLTSTSTSTSTSSFSWSTSFSSSTLRNTRKTIDVVAVVTEDITGNTKEVSTSFVLFKYNVGFKIDRSKGFFYRPGKSMDIMGRITNGLVGTFIGLSSHDYSIKIIITYKETWNAKEKILIDETAMDIDDKNAFTYRIDGYLFTDKIYSMKAEIRLFELGTRNLIKKETVYFSKLRPINGYFMAVEQISRPDVINVGDTARYRISINGPGEIMATYKVTSKGVVVKGGPMFPLSEDQPYEFDLISTKEMVPSFVMLAWSILPLARLSSRKSDYVVAASIETKVKEQQQEGTSIKFEQDSVQPGDNAQLSMKSKSRSAFYILAVDKSVLLLDKGNDITEASLPDLYTGPETTHSTSSSMYSLLYNAGYRVKYFKIGEDFSSTSTPSWHVDIFTSTSSSTVASSSSVASLAASWASTTSQSSSSSQAASSTPGLSTTMAALSTSPTPSTEQPERVDSGKKLETIRKKFPDTWLFVNVTADFSGSASITRKVPDTITTWVANCFAVGPQSRISTAVQKAELEVFIPFFLSLQLPFSVIRNEQLVLQANIFNYHTEDLYVLVTLRKSSSFRGLAVVKRGKRRILEERCGNIVMCVFAKAGRATAVFFPIVPTAIGKIRITITADSFKFKDTVIKNLRVESEGAPRDVAYPILIDLSQETTFDKRMDLNYPPNTVEGSQRMRISLIGDIMGPTIEGLDRLVRMPYGCGEQNMISTAPSVFVYKYLKAVGKLTEELKVKAENFMRIGMQRQLTYRHADWSFSAWGGRGSGSTWLTAFVLKVFSMASHYVDIYELIVTRSADWLISIQNPDGSFPEKGHVNNRALQGGSSGTVERITAYVLIALHEGRRASSNVEFCERCLEKLDEAIKKASNFLANNLDNQTSVYTVAISAYALTITDHNGAWRARNMLDGLSMGGAGQMYWDEPNKPPVSRFHYGRSTLARSIEMTAYGLLAFVESGSKIKALLIQKWLIAQRNPYGGFISTQDTVIGLQALSEVAATSSSVRDMTIVLSYRDVSLRTRKFRITNNNAMIMQMADISTDTSTISMHAWGRKGSVAIFTVSLFYNINMDLEARSLKLNVTVPKETINGFTVRSCVSWLEDEDSGMIVVEVGIPSGFEANRWGISEHKLLKRTEIEERSVILYYDEVTFSEICTDILVSRDKMVAKIKPVPCKAYEYYEPSNQVTVFYEPLSAKNSNICNICGIECGCQTTGEKLWFPQKWCKNKMQG